MNMLQKHDVNNDGAKKKRSLCRLRSVKQGQLSERPLLVQLFPSRKRVV
jgi:hypothetical protein